MMSSSRGCRWFHVRNANEGVKLVGEGAPGLLVLFGKEFRKLEAARPEIACRIAEAMQARAGEIAELVS